MRPLRQLKFLLKYRRLVTIFVHAILFIMAYVFAYLLRFEFDIPEYQMVNFYEALPMVIAIQLMIFGFLGLFHELWHYISIEDVVQLIKANVTASILFLALTKLLGWNSFPRSIIILDFILALGFSSGLRLSLKMFKDYLQRNKYSSVRAHRILIVGAGEAGVMLLKEITRNNPGMGGEVVGFIDDDPLKQKSNIQGVRIMGTRCEIPQVVTKHKVDEIILAIPSADGGTVRGILAHCEKTKTKIQVIPGIKQILSGEKQLKPRDVHPDDLLGRETVTINTEEVRQYIKNRVVLVTGAGGSIGSEICRQVASFVPKELILLDHYENSLYFLLLELKNTYPHLLTTPIIGDVRDVGLLKQVFSRARPQVVFHAAAHKHVPLMEINPAAAVKNNIFGTRNMIYASNHYGVERFVFISTDKAVNPINTMGMSKRVAEMILQARAQKSKTKFMAVRFGNVLGSAGSVVPLFKQQIEKGGPVTLTDPAVKRYFMSIKEACMLVLQAGALGKGGEIFILDMGEQIKVLDLAHNLITLSGLVPEKDIEIQYVGLRPGEKLEEELLLDKEKDAMTQHNKIFVNYCGVTFNRQVLGRNLRRLHRKTQEINEEEINRLLMEIIAAGNI
ncbi:MAG: polysaccharide biosynthesis protein [Candidatus Omnitrophota bacterium]